VYTLAPANGEPVLKFRGRSLIVPGRQSLFVKNSNPVIRSADLLGTPFALFAKKASEVALVGRETGEGPPPRA
jgi:hypothetical protein